MPRGVWIDLRRRWCCHGCLKLKKSIQKYWKEKIDNKLYLFRDNNTNENNQNNIKNNIEEEGKNNNSDNINFNINLNNYDKKELYKKQKKCKRNSKKRKEEKIDRKRNN